MNKRISDFPAEQLEHALTGAEASERLLHFVEASRVMEGASKISPTLIHAVSTLEKFVPIVKMFLGGIMVIYNTFKYINKFRKKKITKMRVASSIVNTGAALAMLALGIAAFAVPALLPVLTLVTVILGTGREIFNFSKTMYSHWKSTKKINALTLKMEREKSTLSESEYEALRQNHRELTFKHTVRRWKIAHRSTDVAIAVASIIAVAVVLAAGPFGWIALGAVTLIGLSVKIGLTIAKRYKLKKLAQQQQAQAVKPEPVQMSEEGELEGMHETEKEQEQEQKQELEQKVETIEHHPHSTREIVEEFKEHPDMHVTEDQVSEQDVANLGKQESQMFKEAAPHPNMKAKKMGAVDEDEDSEGEGEGGPTP